MNDSTHNPVPEPGWQMLGDLELSSGGFASDIIHAWLTDILAQLNLSQDFWTRVLQSAQESASRELLRNEAIPFGHIHLSIFTSYEHISSQKTWGFFHTERTEEQAGSEAAHVHRIKYYLYVEGE